MEVVLAVVAMVCVIVVPIVLCVGVCVYIVHEDREYHEYGGVVHHAATMDALRDAVEEDGLWY